MLPVVATHPVQFVTRDEFRAHEARVCIAEGYVLADPRRPKRFTPEQYFKTQAEMAELFADLPEALANSVAIAQRCNLTIPLGKNYLPAFPTPQASPSRSICATRRQRVSSGDSRCCIRTRRSASASGPNTRRGSSSRSRPSSRWGTPATS